MGSDLLDGAILDKWFVIYHICYICIILGIQNTHQEAKQTHKTTKSNLSASYCSLAHQTTMADVNTICTPLPTTECSSPSATTSLFSLFEFPYVGKEFTELRNTMCKHRSHIIYKHCHSLPAKNLVDKMTLKWWLSQLPTHVHNDTQHTEYARIRRLI